MNRTQPDFGAKVPKSASGEEIYRRGAETQREDQSKATDLSSWTPNPELDSLSGEIIGAAMTVHRELGPGLLESAYSECLSVEFADRGLKFEREVHLPVVFKGRRVDCGYRMDFVIERTIVLEVKALEKVLPVHEAQLLTYLRISGMKLGLMLNFNVPLMKQGIYRRVLS